jgi:hypothetical protein
MFRKPELVDAAVRSGAALEGMIHSLKVGDASSVSAQLAQATLQYSGFTAVEKFNRLHAAQSGINYAQDLAGALAGTKKLPWLRGTKKHMADQLEKMGIDPLDVMQRGGQLTDQQQLDAGFYMSHKTQFGLRPEDVPLGWTSSPFAKVAFQFKGFGLKQAKFIKDDLIKPVKDGNVMPLARFLVAGGVVGGGSEAVRDALAGKFEEIQDKSLMEHFAGGLVAVAMSNILASAYRSAEFGDSLKFLAGPAFGDIGTLFDVVGSDIPRRAFDRDGLDVSLDRPEEVPKVILQGAKKIAPATRQIAGWFEE